MNIFDSEPASYPQSNIPERDAISILQYIIDRRFIKDDIKVLDKVPNIDGTLEITNERQVPLGKIEVQIKKLSEKNIKQPKYQCNKKFLSYCQSSLLPVLLITVDTRNEVAYWCHLSFELLAELKNKIKGNSVCVKTPNENIISKNDKGYIVLWQEIINTYKKKLFDYEKIKAELEENIKKQNKLLEITDNDLLISIPPEDIIEIQIFLDHYNKEIEGRFKIIKEIYYKDIWKIGLAYLSYEKNRLEFSFLNIKYGTVNPQIKAFKNRNDYITRDNESGINGYFMQNPIKNDFKAFSDELILEQLLKIVENRLISLKNVHLANEYVYVFTKKFHSVLGLTKKAVYSLKEIKYGLDVFLNLVITQLGYNDYGFAFDIDMFNWHLSVKDIKTLTSKVTQKIKEGKRIEKKYKLRSEYFSITYLFEQIEYLTLLEVKEVRSLAVINM